MWRVALRPASAADAAAVDPWLAEALRAVAGRSGSETSLTLDGLVRSLSAGQQLRLIALPSGAPVGLLVTSTAAPHLTAIESLAVAAGWRNAGLGAEAVYCLEEAEPSTRLLAGVPLENGLAIYFWLRIGYAPLFPKPAMPALGRDRIWMARGAAEQAT
jgi:ribosomal protein S18 acetylase RimI-like enzyme